MIKNLEIDDIQMKLEFWDTAGQERFRSVVKHYYNDSQGAVVVFDLTKPKSFNDLKYWVQQLNDFADPMLIKMLVGNKSDIDKTIPMEEIQKFCSLNNFFYYETSAKFNKNIDSCFLDLAKKIKERFYIKTSSNEKCNETFVNFKENLKMIKTKDNDGCKC